jgi:hypothetical protein
MENDKVLFKCSEAVYGDCPLFEHPEESPCPHAVPHEELPVYSDGTPCHWGHKCAGKTRDCLRVDMEE